LSKRPQAPNLMSISIVVPLWINDVLATYTTYEKCKQFEEQLRINAIAVPNFTLTNGILRYKKKIYVRCTTNLRKQLIASCHDSALGGHSGERVTYTKLKAPFNWLALKLDVSKFIRHCLTYQKSKTDNTP
jgi:hypothetical protein